MSSSMLQPVPVSLAPGGNVRITVKALKRQTTACDPCRQFKRKCDGRTPCSLCVERNRHCAYTAPVRKRGPKKTPTKPSKDGDIMPAPTEGSRLEKGALQDGYLMLFSNFVQPRYAHLEPTVMCNPQNIAQDTARHAILAFIARRSGHKEIELELTNKARMMSKDIFDTLHKDTAVAFNALEWLYMDGGDYENSRFMSRMAKGIFKQLPAAQQDADPVFASEVSYRRMDMCMDTRALVRARRRNLRWIKKQGVEKWDSGRLAIYVQTMVATELLDVAGHKLLPHLMDVRTKFNLTTSTEAPTVEELVEDLGGVPIKPEPGTQSPAEALNAAMNANPSLVQRLAVQLVAEMQGKGAIEPEQMIAQIAAQVVAMSEGLEQLQSPRQRQQPDQAYSSASSQSPSPSHTPSHSPGHSETTQGPSTAQETVDPDAPVTADHRRFLLAMLKAAEERLQNDASKTPLVRSAYNTVIENARAYVHWLSGDLEAANHSLDVCTDELVKAGLAVRYVQENVAHWLRAFPGILFELKRSDLLDKIVPVLQDLKGASSRTQEAYDEVVALSALLKQRMDPDAGTFDLAAYLVEQGVDTSGGVEQCPIQETWVEAMDSSSSEDLMDDVSPTATVDISSATLAVDPSVVEVACMQYSNNLRSNLEDMPPVVRDVLNPPMQDDAMADVAAVTESSYVDATALDDIAVVGAADPTRCSNMFAVDNTDASWNSLVQ
eukprot:GFYU01002112.1.p1 GENE.GFYU01002112.1~~GFYU01002112.1.p1  ORF type:complete len:719 (-),score=171.79 GFYU01002112.1:101-2257(-)